MADCDFRRNAQGQEGSMPLTCISVVSVSKHALRSSFTASRNLHVLTTHLQEVGTLEMSFVFKEYNLVASLLTLKRLSKSYIEITCSVDGVKNVQEEEMTVFLSGIKDISLNLELGNAGVVLSGNDKLFKKGANEKSETLWMAHVVKELLHPILDTSAHATNGKGLLDFTIPKQLA